MSPVPPTLPARRRRRAVAALTLTAGGLALSLLALSLSAGPAVATTHPLAVAPKGSVVVKARGNGHGHGMSQYGARGAAQDGKSYRQILAFYYRGTKLTREAPTRIRVRLSGYGKTTTVAARPGLTVTGVSGALPSTAARYRLIADAGQGLTLQRLADTTHAHWTNYRTGLPDHAGFWAGSSHSIRLYAGDGSSTYYYGGLRANRAAVTGSAAGVYTVDRVSLNRYTAGVAPREMPASWGRAAVNSQAVAARTYGEYAVEHPQNSRWDICDTTSCQVYGGHSHLDSAGNVAYTDYPQAAADTSDEVLTYHGHTIFSQFSASNGGWESDGGQPYLVSQADPYDTSAAGDPYAAFTSSVTTKSIASWFGLASLSKITVTARDGNGQWGGRVESVTLTGKRNGHTTTLDTDGSDLAGALGLGTTWFTVQNP